MWGLFPTISQAPSYGRPWPPSLALLGSIMHRGVTGLPHSFPGRKEPESPLSPGPTPVHEFSRG